jgi:hypothetical protein
MTARRIASAVENHSDGISIEELRALQSSSAPLLIVDVRAETSFKLQRTFKLKAP